VGLVGFATAHRPLADMRIQAQAQMPQMAFADTKKHWSGRVSENEWQGILRE